MEAEPVRLTGGCHCRLLRYTVNVIPFGAYVCHCTDCQSLSGAAFAVAVVVPAPAFVLTGSPRLVPRVLGSGRTSYRWICPECGVWVSGGSRTDLVASDEWRVVRGGTFDDTSWIRPGEHFWVRSAQSWVIIPDGVRVHMTQP